MQFTTPITEEELAAWKMTLAAIGQQDWLLDFDGIQYQPIVKRAAYKKTKTICRGRKAKPNPEELRHIVNLCPLNATRLIEEVELLHKIIILLQCGWKVVDSWKEGEIVYRNQQLNEKGTIIDFVPGNPKQSTPIAAWRDTVYYLEQKAKNSRAQM